MAPREWTTTEDLAKQVHQMAVDFGREQQKTEQLENSMEKIWMKFEELQDKIHNVEKRLAIIMAFGAIFQTIAISIVIKLVT